MDNHHVSISSSSASCAILELSGIAADADKVLYAVATRLYHPARGNPAAFLMWSDVCELVGNSGDVRCTNGVNLYSHIRDHKICSGLLSSNIVENPLTGNPIRVWLAEINHTAFKNWYRDERVRRARRV